MEPVDPRVSQTLLPQGSTALVFAESQKDLYVPVPAIRTPDGKVVTRWALSDADRRALILGADVYVTTLTFQFPLQPLMVSVGPLDLTKVDELGRSLPADGSTT